MKKRLDLSQKENIQKQIDSVRHDIKIMERKIKTLPREMRNENKMWIRNARGRVKQCELLLLNQ
jgi:hypothetical protein